MNDTYPEVKLNRLLNEASNSPSVRRLAALCLESGLPWYEMESHTAPFMAYMRDKQGLASPYSMDTVVEMAKADLRAEAERERRDET